MAILGGAALLLFGPDQLPRVLRKVGQFTREVQNTSQSFIREMERAADPYEPPAAPVPDDVYAPSYESAPYESTVGPSPAYDVATPYVEAPDLPDPDPEPPVGEKLAEPRPALDLAEHRSGAAEPSPQRDHSPHV